MKFKLAKHRGVVAILGASVIGTAILPLHPATAQRAFRSDLVGNWTSNLGDFYTLRSNGTYTFTIGDLGMGNIAHSGTWSLTNGGHTLRLHATRRVVLEGKRRRTLSANKTFRLEVENLDPETISLDGAHFHRPRSGRAYSD